MTGKQWFLWTLWILVSAAIVTYLAYPLISEDGDKSMYLIGDMTHGHHQIEMSCTVCHATPFGGKEVLQDACINCHGEELKRADDSHPKSKFTDPRNADRVAILDARYCITCHTEHQPDLTHAMGLTMPEDYCIKCHADVAEERPTHEGLDFKTCATGGCHNFHDNRALYEDFLVKHQHEAAVLAEATVKQLNYQEYLQAIDQAPLPALDASKQDAPLRLAVEESLVHDWAETAHARAGINCSECHYPVQKNSDKRVWLDRPDHTVCQSCHTPQVEGFLQGKHGMRLAQDLSPMQPGMARIAMHKDSANEHVSCVSCHSAHRFDSRQAAVDSCLDCHADDHTLAYESSPHADLWRRVLSGELKPGQGVSCATCHMPRISKDMDGFDLVHVQHNQNDNLRPNEKMIRSVCMSCHGLGFSIDALADRDLINTNFNGKPARHIEGIDWSGMRAREATTKDNIH
jgi:hypothetical protein